MLPVGTKVRVNADSYGLPGYYYMLANADSTGVVQSSNEPLDAHSRVLFDDGGEYLLLDIFLDVVVAPLRKIVLEEVPPEQLIGLDSYRSYYYINDFWGSLKKVEKALRYNDGAVYVTMTDGEVAAVPETGTVYRKVEV